MKRTLAAIVLPFATFAIAIAGYGRREDAPATGIAAVTIPLAAPAAASTRASTGSNLSRYADAIERLKAVLEDSDIQLYKVLNGWDISAVFYVFELGEIKQIYDQFTGYEKRKLQRLLYYIKYLLKSRYAFKAPQDTASPN